MSRKRDTNWNRDEITVLLDSILEITRMRADDGKRTNSREVFEYAAKRLGEKGHSSRAEREKCRTKWKKMKEEYTHAKKAREGDSRYKEAPGIQPFFDRMEEFINGNFDNISPHSTIVRRSSSISSSNNTTSNATTASSSSSSGTSCKNSPISRSSARIAANNTTAATIGAIVINEPANEIGDLSSTNSTSPSTGAQRQQLQQPASTPSDLSSSRQPSSRLSSGSDSNTNILGNHNNSNNLFPSSTVDNNVTNSNASTERGQTNLSSYQNHQHNHVHQINQQHQKQPNNYPNLAQQQSQKLHTSAQFQAIPNGEIGPNVSRQASSHNTNHNVVNNLTPANSHQNNLLNDSIVVYPMSASQQQQAPQLPAEHADISYRVSTGCRQITIFGDHDVDIKFRGDCVTINKISSDHNNCSAGGNSSGFRSQNNNSNLGTKLNINNTIRDMDGDECL